MGCASSKGDINDQHPNIFQVMNVDDEFRPISPGQIEITDTELIFYQRAKKPTTWSLRNLRKYGFDSEIFSFECGRRCATGEGIFAFKCKKAEQLFNLLQHNIQVRNMSEENHDNSTPLSSNSQPNQREVQRRSGATSQTDGYLNPVTTNGRPPLSRPGSITSNGPTTPPASSLICPPTLQSTAAQLITQSQSQSETNNNKSNITGLNSIRQASIEHSYLNSEMINFNMEVGHQYINLPASNINVNSVNTVHESVKNVYMNIDTSCASLGHIIVNQGTPVKPIPVTIEIARDEDEKNVVETVVLPQLPLECQTCSQDAHCYANIDANALTTLSALDADVNAVNTGGGVGCNGMGMYNFVIGESVEVNYVELDLEPSGPVSAGKLRAPITESPVKGKPYVTIDFKKTDALSHSINPRLELEEGCRKTRHNSTIGDIRHSSSVSD